MSQRPFEPRTKLCFPELSKQLRGFSTLNQSQISQFLSDAELDLKGFEDEIQRHKAIVVSLENRREGLLRHIKAYKSLLSPIRRLSTEILARIFTTYCQDKGIVLGTRPTSVPVLELCQVSSVWRALAIATPRLWSNLKIDIVSYHHSQFISLVLKRSKQSPLTLSISLWRSLQVDNRCISALQILVNHSWHWQRVSLNICDDTLLHPVFEGILDRLPMLEYLQIERRLLSFGITTPPTDLFSSAPKLREFSSSLTCVDHVRLNWNQLTSLKFIGTLSYPKVLELMVTSLRVEEVCLSGCLNDVDDFSGAYTIFNHISTLALDFQDSSSLRHLFCRITLPNLRTLSLKDVPDRRCWDSREITDFLTRSGSKVTSLSILSCALCDMDVIDILEVCLSLTKLTVHEYRERNRAANNCIITPKFASKLRVDHSTPSITIIPKLEELNLGFYLPAVDGLTDSLCSLVRSRWNPDPEYAKDVGVGCLKAVSLAVIGDKVNSECFDSLKCLQVAGLRFSVGRLGIQDNA